MSNPDLKKYYINTESLVKTENNLELGEFKPVLISLYPHSSDLSNSLVFVSYSDYLKLQSEYDYLSSNMTRLRQLFIEASEKKANLELKVFKAVRHVFLSITDVSSVAILKNIYDTYLKEDI